ncbi:MAG: hypothetical protein ACREO8_13095 [Luteimonas sp.]
MTARKASTRIKQTTSRHVWLASLGVIAATGDGLSNAAIRGARDAGMLRSRMQKIAGDAGLLLRGGVITLQERFELSAAQLRDVLASRLIDALGVFERPFTATRPARRPLPRAAAGRSRR